MMERIEKLGQMGDLVKVKPGYARNFLMPRGLGIAWTRGGEKQVTQIKRARKVREIRDLGHANEVKQELESLKVTLSAKAGDTGRLFGSVTTADIADAVKAAGGPAIEKRKVTLAAPVKTVGSYSATVLVHEGVVAKLNFEVLAG